jgi:hypothetical protein
MVLIPLQVFANIATIILDESGPAVKVSPGCQSASLKNTATSIVTARVNKRRKLFPHQLPANRPGRSKT